MMRSRVVFPEPLSPEDGEEFSLSDIQGDVAQHGVLAERLGHVADGRAGSELKLWRRR